MKELEKRILDIKEQLEFFEDELEKYEYIIDLGKKLEGLEDSYKIDQYLVQGCTSLVWLVPEYKDGKIYLKADSEALIVKGLVNIIINIFSGLEDIEIKDFNINILKSLGLSEIITPNRQSGVAGMIAKVTSFAKESYENNR